MLGAPLPANSGKEIPPPSPSGPPMATGSEFKRRRKGKSGNLIPPPTSSPFFPLPSPHLQLGVGRERAQGQWRITLDSPLQRWQPCVVSWLQVHWRPTQGGAPSPTIDHHIFVFLPLWWSLLPSTLCQCLIKFNLQPKKMKINRWTWNLTWLTYSSLFNVMSNIFPWEKPDNILKWP